jgi:hypothetical protein
VYLLTKNLRTERLSKRLDYVKVGPFLIKSQQEPVTYTLDLLLDTKIYPRFYVNRLELADLETPLQRTFRYAIEEENEFEVKTIVLHKRPPDN